MSKQKSKFQGLFEPQASQPDQPVGDQVMKSDATEEILQERKEEIKKSRIQERVKTNYEIRRDYVQALKRVAVDEDRKIYEVMEQAIAEYLERHQESKT
jgi:predicted transcriptional regulator